MNGRFGTIALTIVLVVVIAFTFLIYIYPAGGINPLNKNVVTNNTNTYAENQNQAALQSFLQRYNFSNVTYLPAFYQVPSSSEIIFNCGYGMIPNFQVIPSLLVAQNTSAMSTYDSFVSDMGTLTACGLGVDLPRCSYAKSQLYNLTMEYFNYTVLSGVFNQTAQTINDYYLVTLTFQDPNSTYFDPLHYDEALMNSKNRSKSYLASSLIGLESLPAIVLDLQNGTVIGETNEFVDINGSIANAIAGEFYVPFQFPSVIYPTAPVCNSSLTIFNMVSDISSFMTTTYSALYAALGANVTNICVNSSSNSCDSQTMGGLDAPFYV